MKYRIFLDSFSGAVVDLKRNQRTEENVLAVLSKSPRVSTFDMSELPWLRNIIYSLIKQGKVIEDKSEAYPWHKYKPVESTSIN